MPEQKRTALITGAAGQDGILLAELLTAENYEVWGFVREGSAGLGVLNQRVPSIRVFESDIRDAGQFSMALDLAEPDEVYNLAAFSSVARSWANAREVMDTNATALVGLLDAIRDYRGRSGRELRFYQASSSEMFGEAQEAPQTEATAFHPRSPYGVAKSAAHLLTVNYRESYGMFACSGILYNHESPLRPESFVTRKITKAVAEIARGRADHVRLGALDISRDWGYAPDYVRAMWLMLQHDVPSDYIVASGVSHSLVDFLTVAFGVVGIMDWSPYVLHDSGLLRPAEVVGLVGDSSKAKNVLSWRPSVDFHGMVELMVEYDLERLQAE